MAHHRPPQPADGGSAMTGFVAASGRYRATATSGIDRAIRLSTAAAVLAVAGIAAYVSYWQAYAVVRAHGETGITARLEPATIDGLVWASSMVVLYAARHRVSAVPAPTWTGTSPASHRSPRCRTRPGSTTRNRAARSTCAPGLSPPGPSYGRCCATTTDAGPRRRSFHGHLARSGCARCMARNQIQPPSTGEASVGQPGALLRHAVRGRRSLEIPRSAVLVCRPPFERAGMA
jgi:hypothetical protein